jgi:PGAP1-like protein
MYGPQLALPARLSCPVLALAICLAFAFPTGCAPPIQVRRMDARHVHRTLTSNELTVGAVSRRTRNLLYNYDLVERFERDPPGALRELHHALITGSLLPEERAALAELAFHYAAHGGGRPYYLASALYAWAYLFPDDPHERPDRFSPRERLACDIYNLGLTHGIKDGGDVDLRAGTFALPFGALEVAFDPARLQWGDHQLVNFVPIAEIEVTGFPTYYRWPGIGAPLAAGVTTHEGAGDRDLLARRVRVPVTALLRPEDLTAALRSGRVRATLEVYPGYGDRSVTIGDRQVPLETEPTAALGLMLSEVAIWGRELTGFLHGIGVIDERARLVSLRPYRPGLIPVVFVHGTASSAARWAQLCNELDNDPRIHARYQFWFFSYETGNPIAYSALLLRESLTRAVARLDPDGRDPALQRMVVIGHSQGGLLTKAMVVESGSRFWANVSRKPIEEVRVSERTRDLLRRGLFFHPLPFVRRVVFIATPHHGSYIAGNWLAHQVARLVRAPLDVTRAIADVATGDRDALLVRGTQALVPTSVDNMTPGNSFVRTLADLPIAPGVTAHSIIAVKDGVPSATATDGVVAYTSAHIDGVESELVVKSPHSCQANSHTIGEVRRILLLHAEAADGAGESALPPGSGPAAAD